MSILTLSLFFRKRTNSSLRQTGQVFLRSMAVLGFATDLAIHCWMPNLKAEIISQFLWVRSPGTALLGASESSWKVHKAHDIVVKGRWVKLENLLWNSLTQLLLALVAWLVGMGILHRLSKNAHSMAVGFTKDRESESAKTEATVCCKLISQEHFPAQLPYSIHTREEGSCKGVDSKRRHHWATLEMPMQPPPLSSY